MRAVIVEDAVDVLYIEQLQLEGAGMEVIATFRTAADAIEGWPERVDVAVVDLMMSGLSGWGLLAWLMVNQPNVRRVVVTAAPEDEIERVKSLAHAVIRKPFFREQFLDAVKGT